MVGNVQYQTDGAGRWWRRKWPNQCSFSDVFIDGQCQGVEGHEGNHWSYSKTGDYHWHVNSMEGLGKWDVVCGTTPAGHKEWISPVDMAEHTQIAQYVEVEIDDPELIAKLEAGDPPEEMASIVRPIPCDEYEELVERGILPDKRDKDA